MPDIEAIIQLKEEVKTLSGKTDDLSGDIKQIKEAIVGDGKPGLKTEMALAKQSIGRIWWWLSGISMTIIGSAIWIIRSSL